MWICSRLKTQINKHLFVPKNMILNYLYSNILHKKCIQLLGISYSITPIKRIVPAYQSVVVIVPRTNIMVSFCNIRFSCGMPCVSRKTCGSNGMPIPTLQKRMAISFDNHVVLLLIQFLDCSMLILQHPHMVIELIICGYSKKHQYLLLRQRQPL